MVFWTFSKYPLYLSSILLAQHCALKLPNPEQTYDLLCLWRLHRRIKRCCLRLELAYFLSKFHATLLVQPACREVSSKTDPPDCPFLSRRHGLSSRLLLIALTDKQGKGIDCNGSSLPLFSNPSVLRIANDIANFLESLCNSSESR